MKAVENGPDRAMPTEMLALPWARFGVGVRGSSGLLVSEGFQLNLLTSVQECLNAVAPFLPEPEGDLSVSTYLFWREGNGPYFYARVAPLNGSYLAHIILLTGEVLDALESNPFHLARPETPGSGIGLHLLDVFDVVEARIRAGETHPIDYRPPTAEPDAAAPQEAAPDLQDIVGPSLRLTDSPEMRRSVENYVARPAFRAKPHGFALGLSADAGALHERFPLRLVVAVVEPVVLRPDDLDPEVIPIPILEEIPIDNGRDGISPEVSAGTPEPPRELPPVITVPELPARPPQVPWGIILLAFFAGIAIASVLSFVINQRNSASHSAEPTSGPVTSSPPVVSSTAGLITELADLEGELEFSQSERNNLSAQKSEKARMIAQLRSGANPGMEWEKDLQVRQQAVVSAQAVFNKVQAKATAAEAGVQKANEVWESGKLGADKQRQVLERQRQDAITAAKTMITAAQAEVAQCNTQVTEAKSAVAAEEENAKRKPEDPNADRRTQAKNGLDKTELEVTRAETDASLRKDVLDKAKRDLQGNRDAIRRYTDSANSKRATGDSVGAKSDEQKADVLANLTGNLEKKVDTARNIFAAANTDLMMSRAKRDQAKAELDAIPSPPESTGDTRALDAARKRLRDAEKAQSEAQVKLRAAEGELKTAEGMNTDPGKVVDPRPNAQRAKVEAQKNLDQAQKKLGDAEKVLQEWQGQGRPNNMDASGVIASLTREIQGLDQQIAEYKLQDKQTQARIAEVKKKIKSASAQGKNRQNDTPNRGGP